MNHMPESAHPFAVSSGQEEAKGLSALLIPSPGSQIKDLPAAYLFSILPQLTAV